MRTGIRCFMTAAIVFAGFAVSHGAPAADGVQTRLYITNSLGDDVTVVDLGTFKAVADIKVGDHVHGVCAPADGRTVFTTVESEKVLKIIDTATNEITASIALTGRPNQCASTPNGRFVAVPIRDVGGLDIIDIPQKKVVKVLPINVPHNCFNTGSNTEMYCSSEDDHQIDLIDLKKLEYAKKFDVGGIPRPYAVSKDQKTMYVAVTALHGFVIVNTTDQTTRRVELPPAPASPCEKLEPNTPTHGLALTPDGRQLWVTSLADAGVYVYDVASGKISSEIPTGSCPNWISFSPDGKYMTVSNSASDSASIIDTKTRKEVARVKAGKAPKRLLAINIPAA